MPTATMLQTSGAYEYYTPAPIIEAARETMGGIDLDPASSWEANRIVGATDYYTKDLDGLHPRWPWYGRLWMNHPFGRGQNHLWIRRWLTLENGDGLPRLCITYACTSEAWFRPLLYLPQCFLTPRTNYLLPDGSVKKGVQKGSVVTYLGDDVERFRRAFKALGVVKV